MSIAPMLPPAAPIAEVSRAQGARVVVELDPQRELKGCTGRGPPSW